MPDPRYTALARRFGDALRVGDPDQADGVIGDALAAQAPPDAIQSLVIAPAMRRIGELWAAGIVSVAEEHLATSISQRALVRLYAVLSAGRPAAPPRARVLLAAIEGQRHVLGLQMVADVLYGAGFDVLYLGGDVPVDDLRAFVEERSPAVVGLAFPTASPAGRFADALLAVHAASAETRIMLGGQGVPVGLREAGYPWVTASTSAVQTVEELVAGPPQRVPEIIDVLASGGGADADLLETAIETDAIAEQFARVADDATDVVRRHLRAVADGGARSSGAGTTEDPLTGLLTRGAILERLRQAADAPDVPGMVLVVDVDDFRTLDATHGHETADAVLRSIADVLRDVMSPEDVIGRTGGNEFTALLPGATRDAATRVGSRLQAAVTAGTTPPVAVSVGTAPLTGDPRAVLLAVWTDLYTAKKAARRAPAAETEHPGVAPGDGANVPGSRIARS